MNEQKIVVAFTQKDIGEVTVIVEGTLQTVGGAMVVRLNNFHVDDFTIYPGKTFEEVNKEVEDRGDGNDG